MSGRNLTVGRRAYFGTGNEITIGNNSGIGKKAQIIGLGPESNLSIGDNVMMGPEVMILLSDHGHSRVDIPMNEQSCYSSSIKIEDDVWIGARVIILKGVTIGKGSIIGAGAVVARDIPPYSVAVGTPARAIKSRSGDTSSKEVQE
jgi:maltose O-acetyltransferase